MVFPESPYPAPSVLQKIGWFANGYTPLFADYFILYFTLLTVCVVIVWLAKSDIGKDLDKWFYLLFSAVIVLFAACRPVYTAMDDHGYLLRFADLCSFPGCGPNAFLKRDPLWHLIVSGLKSLYPRPEVMFWVAGLGLAMKLLVVYCLSSWRTLSLLLYVSIFYLVDDITALRGSLAVSFYLLSFLALVNDRLRIAFCGMLASGLSHAQGFFSFLLYLGRPCLEKRALTVGIILAPLFMLLSGFYPNKEFVQYMINQPLGKWLVNPGGAIPEVVLHTLDLNEGDVRSFPIVYPPLFVMSAVLAWDLYPKKEKCIYYSAASIAIASLLFWFYAISFSIQFRLSNFFLVPLVIMAGSVRRNGWWPVPFLLISAIFVAKYNLKHTMLFDPSRIVIASQPNGHVEAKYTSVCQYHCIYDMDTATLDALPNQGFVFSGWSGECFGQDNPCHLSVYKNASLSAIFAPAVSLKVEKMGQGDLVSTPPVIQCGKNCSGNLPKDSSVRLSAQPANGWYFKQWGGACSGSDPVCVMSMSSDTGVLAKFVQRFGVKISLSGRGTIKRDSVNVICKEDCEIQELGDTDLTITAQPEPGYRFDGWSGACSHMEYACTFMLTGNTSLSARFVAEEPLPPTSP